MYISVEGSRRERTRDGQSTEGERLCPGPEHQPLPPHRRRQSLSQMKGFSRLSFLSVRNENRFTLTWETEILAFSLSENFLLHFRKKTKLLRADRTGRHQVSRGPRLPTAQAGAASSRQHALGSQPAPTTQLNRQETSPGVSSRSSHTAPSMGHLGLSILAVSSQLHWKAHKQREGGSRDGGIRSPTVFFSLYLSAKA